MNNLEQILKRERFGLVLRVFAGKPEAVKTQCDRTLDLARKASLMQTGNMKVYKRILIMVAADSRRVDYDCGESVQYIKNELRDDPCSTIRVIECLREDLFCGVLNKASAELLRNGCKYMSVFSHAARDYQNLDFMEKASEAFHNGAVAAGFAITELQESIQNGALANTGMIWDLDELVSVGGFDHSSEQPFKNGHHGLFTDERQVSWVQGKRPEGKDALYPCAGVEEIIPLIRLTRKHDRPCIAPIMPSDGKVWEEPTDPDELARHMNKLATKRARQESMSGHVQANLSVLEDAVMEKYSWKA